MTLEELKNQVNQRQLPPDGYKGKVRCRVTGLTGKLRYYYAKDSDTNNMVAVVNPDNLNDILDNDEILPENMEMV
jgi:hypothetical protein